MGSFTCSSQHYQTYNDYPLVVHPKYKAEFIGPGGGLIAAMFAYEDLMARDIPKEEARQTLPNAMAVNILWTVNARSLANFFRQRCCNRNTAEMQLFANRLLAEVIKVWPLFENVFGPPCKTGKCNQRHMQCAEGEWSNHESL
jgi:thymidylate synthase (FAD)